jgi:hypothetical protein
MRVLVHNWAQEKCYGRAFDKTVGRDVLRVGASYLAVSWLVPQIIDVTSQMLDLPAGTGRIAITTLIAIPITWSMGVRQARSAHPT